MRIAQYKSKKVSKRMIGDEILAQYKYIFKYLGITRVFEIHLITLHMRI